MPVVVKQIPKSRISKFVCVEGRSIPSEIYFHMTASGAPGVVKALEFFERRTSWVLIMEKPSNSIDLFEFSSQFGALSEDAAKIIFRQVVESCIHLKSRGVFHRDLKDENILLDIKTLETKIIDFGCATDYEERDYTELTGTPEFCCPEYYTVSQYKPESSTIWTLGTFLYVLLFGDIPYENKTDIIRGIRTKVNFLLISHNFHTSSCSFLKLIQTNSILNYHFSTMKINYHQLLVNCCNHFSV